MSAMLPIAEGWHEDDDWPEGWDADPWQWDAVPEEWDWQESETWDGGQYDKGESEDLYV